MLTLFFSFLMVSSIRVVILLPVALFLLSCWYCFHATMKVIYCKYQKKRLAHLFTHKIICTYICNYTMVLNMVVSGGKKNLVLDFGLFYQIWLHKKQSTFRSFLGWWAKNGIWKSLLKLCNNKAAGDVPCISRIAFLPFVKGIYQDYDEDIIYSNFTVTLFVFSAVIYWSSTMTGSRERTASLLLPKASSLVLLQEVTTTC